MTTGERQMRADARRNYARLIDAAREAFTTHGVEASLDEVARSAGVGPGTLYRHFPNRHALVAAVYRDDVDTLARQADGLAETHPPDQALAAWLRRQLDLSLHKRGLHAAFKEMLVDDAETFTWCRDTLRAAAGKLLANAQAAGAIRADIDATTVLRLVYGVAVASESAREQADQLLSYLLDGLRPQRSAAPD